MDYQLSPVVLIWIKDFLYLAVPARYYYSLSLEWKKHLPTTFKYVCITDIMDHVIAEGNRIFEGSTHEHDWCIYHDRLSQWWEKDAQAYLAAMRSVFRTTRCEGTFRTGRRHERSVDTISRRQFVRRRMQTLC